MQGRRPSPSGRNIVASARPGLVDPYHLGPWVHLHDLSGPLFDTVENRGGYYLWVWKVSNFNSRPLPCPR
jgi:hypothetical protein